MKRSDLRQRVDDLLDDGYPRTIRQIARCLDVELKVIQRMVWAASVAHTIVIVGGRKNGEAHWTLPRFAKSAKVAQEPVKVPERPRAWYEVFGAVP